MPNELDDHDCFCIQADAHAPHTKQPQDVPGLQDCKRYMTQKQYYTLQDMLVVQYILNDGILMRQMHNTEDEYHVDINEPLS